MGLHLLEHEKGLHPISIKARLVEKPQDHRYFHFFANNSSITVRKKLTFDMIKIEKIKIK